MRWDRLFDDLESQLDREQRDEERALAIEEERLRLGRLHLRDRLLALVHGAGAEQLVRVELSGGRRVAVRIQTFGRDWISVALPHPDRPESQAIIPLGAIAAILPDRAQLEPSIEPVSPSSARLAERMTMTFVLRDLCRRRTPVEITTLDGTVHGTLDRVARDHFDLAVHERGAARRERDVQSYRIMPVERVTLIRFD